MMTDGHAEANHGAYPKRERVSPNSDNLLKDVENAYHDRNVKSNEKPSLTGKGISTAKP
jgi:hypothetical protein